MMQDETKQIERGERSGAMRPGSDARGSGRKYSRRQVGRAEHGITYRLSAVLVLLAFGSWLADSATAQQPAGPPAVGVVRAEREQITQTDEFVGRVQAGGRVTVVARATAFLEKRLFVEGSE